MIAVQQSMSATCLQTEGYRQHGTVVAQHIFERGIVAGGIPSRFGSIPSHAVVHAPMVLL